MFQYEQRIGSSIRTVNKYIDNLKSSDLVSEVNNIKIHLFSNIIDVESFSLDNLHNLILSSFQGLNRFICTSPNNNRKCRLDDFCELFSRSCQIHNLVSFEESVYDKVFYFKTKRWEDREITRCERQFTINLS
jgi:hypothetical protein